MNGYRWLAFSLLCLVFSGAARAELALGQGLGMVPSPLTREELTTPVPFRLTLDLYPSDLRKKQVLGGTAGMLDLRTSYSEVVSWLMRLGFSVLKTDPNCVMIELQGTRQQLANALQISFVRESELSRSVIVPICGHSLPYRPSGSVLSIDHLIMDFPPSLAASDVSLGLLRDQEASERRLAGLYPGS